MADPVKTEYSAQDEWNREMRSRMVPGNTPARVMRAAIARFMDPSVRETLVNEHKSDFVRKWPSLQKMEKVEAVSDMKSLDDVRELLYIEDDEDIQECLITRKRELKG